MSKFSSFVAACATVGFLGSTAFGTSSSPSTSFNGLYTGVSAGWFFKKHDIRTNTDIPNLKKNHKFTQYPVDFHLGYLQSCPNGFLWGIETTLGYAFGDKTSNLAPNLLNFKAQTGFFTELVGKMGWNFGPVAAYGIMGVSGHSIKYTIKRTTTGRSNSEKTFVPGFVVGAGLGYEFLPRWTVGGEFKHHFQKTQSFIDRSFNPALTVNLKNRTSDFRIRLDYAF